MLYFQTSDAHWLDGLRRAFEEASSNGRQVSKESGTRHINDLVNGDPAFEGVYIHPKILGAVYHVLRCLLPPKNQTPIFEFLEPFLENEKDQLRISVLAYLVEKSSEEGLANLLEEYIAKQTYY